MTFWFALLFILWLQSRIIKKLFKVTAFLAGIILAGTAFLMIGIYALIAL